MFRTISLRVGVCAAALSLLVACAPNQMAQRSVEECPTLTPSQLRSPIEGEALRLDDWMGNLPDFEMVVNAPLDANGYVQRPSVASSRPVGISSRQILEAISTWRFCPEVARSLGGRPLKIPISGRRAGAVGAPPGSP